MIKDIAAAFFLILVMVWLIAISFGGPSLEDIGSPCRGHGGVRQWVPNQITSTGIDGRGIVVCIDGKIGRVK